LLPPGDGARPPRRGSRDPRLPEGCARGGDLPGRRGRAVRTGGGIPLTVGWTAYFCFADTFLPFGRLDKWLRRRLRQIRWKEWKRPKTRYRSLRALGLPERDCRDVAASQKGYWAISHSPQLQRALRNAYWHKTMGLKGFLDPYRRLRTC
jgi:Group II intron, maturase-specific domain